MENDEDIIANHKKMMNKNYYNEDHQKSAKNNVLKPYYILPKNDQSKIIDLNEFYKIQYDKDSYIYIKKNFFKWYGGYFKQYEFIQNDEKYYYQSIKDKTILEINPFLVLTSLIDNGINPILVPKCIINDENDKNLIKIIFDNSIKFLINKETKEIKDPLKNYEDDEEENNENGNEINEEKKEQIYGLTNDIMKESDIKMQQMNNDKLMGINQSLEIAKIEKKEKLDNEALFKDLLKEKNIKEDGIFEKDIFKIKFDQRYNLIPSLLEKEKLYKEYVSELKKISKEKKGEMKELRKAINKYKLFLKERIEKNDFDLEMNYIDFYDKYYDVEEVKNLPEQHRELIFNETKFKLKEIYENNKQETKQKYLSFIEKEFPPDKVRLITTIDQIKNVLKLKKEYLSVSSKTERNEIIKEYLDKVKNFIKNRNDHIEKKRKEEEEKRLLEEKNKDLKVKDKYKKNKNKNILNKDKKENITKNMPLKYTTIKDLEYNNNVLVFKKFLAERVKRRIQYEEAILLFTKEYGKDATNNLEEEILQKIYKLYIGNLVMKQKDEFNQLLNEYIQYNVDIPWGEAQRMMQYDVRYQNIIPSEREAMYRDYRDNIYNRVLSQFENLVNEREDLITKDTPLEGYEYNKLLISLRNDPRAQRIERYPDKRDKIIRAKVKELKHKFWDEEKKKKTQLLNKKTERERNAKLYRKWQKGNVIQ